MSKILEYLGGIETIISDADFNQVACDFRIPRRDWNIAKDFIQIQIGKEILEYLGGIET